MRMLLKMTAYIDVPKELEDESMEDIFEILAPRIDVGEFDEIHGEPVALEKEEE